MHKRDERTCLGEGAAPSIKYILYVRVMGRAKTFTRAPVDRTGGF